MTKRTIILIFSLFTLSCLIAVGSDTFQTAVPIETLPFYDTGNTTNMTNTMGFSSNDTFYN